MSLRALLYFQIVWIALVGLMVRGVIPYPGGKISDLILIGALYLFPLAVAIAIFRSKLTSGYRWGVGLLQLGLSYAYFVAILPACQ